MKTVSDLQKLIDDIDYIKELRNDKPWMRKAGRERKFYYKVKLYLETEPREQFLHNMKANMERHIEHIISVITHKMLADLYPKLT